MGGKPKKGKKGKKKKGVDDKLKDEEQNEVYQV
jgi:hypothetical protein